MEKNLTSSADRADYLVDLSNVVRDTTLGGTGPRSLRRLELVVKALVALTGDPGVTLYLVADRSLLAGAREFTDPEDVRLLRHWVGEGLVEEVGDADERVLEIAGMTGTRVVTGDHYVPYRDEHPWLQGNTWQFLRPERRHGRLPGPGVVVLVPMDMGHRSAVEISRKLELDALKKQGLLDARRTPLAEVVRRSWSCPEPRCSLYDTRSGGRILLPRMRRGVPTCELHGAALLEAGPRTGTAQLKAVLDGLCAARYTLDEGSLTVVGRSPGADGIALHALLPPERAARVSRRHLGVSVRQGTVRVEDVSTYGTRIRRADRRGRLGLWQQLPPRTEQGFRPGDELELAPGVVLVRSGRLFPAELSDVWRTAVGRTPPPTYASSPTRVPDRRLP
ncbi:FHA domain-containing protein [Kitasatospora sp. NBC_00240]|uniref:FHA domain-containing protein n=1 Tax=Kitasatospora sp. NBC_00240 TaxID=2903567 RepID=UPI00225004AF|nr:FHA domain-containing protein [Kitasatospora sp. NBC_00240]MCX5214128.1 FHA domain-containing protein [Kitasatospora sp. NBC_00240]